MPFPLSLRETLLNVGQAAVEVDCSVPGYREFVTIYYGKTLAILAFRERFPYYADCDVIYRLIRFRVEKTLLDEDHNFGNEDLLGIQEIYLPSEAAVEFVLDLWHVPMDSFKPPDQTEVPV